MADADMSNLTATPTKDATAEDIAELKQTINRIEAERQNINRRAGASLKGSVVIYSFNMGQQRCCACYSQRREPC